MGGNDDRRAMRVFVSSTFRDMQAERDELVKRVFPRLRRMCEQRGVAWSEIDLRWGVTDEQKAEGAVLPICLAEIDRTRPYFIGLLGQRYGWVPDELPDALVHSEPWLADDPGRSVTEMEIVHGVLDRPDDAVDAFFYLRDPVWVEQLPPAQREWYLEADDVGRARLAALRERVRSSGHPVAVYTDPEQLGELVLADLTALIERVHPIEVATDPARRTDAVHRAFGAARFRPWVERPDLEARLDAHATTDDVPLLLTGPAGVGCSALVTNWAAAWARRHPDDTVLVHHVEADVEAGDARSLVARLVAALDPTAALGPTVDRLATATPPQLRASLAAAARGRDRRTVLVLDGVDRLDDTDRAVDLRWMPDRLPARVRLIVTGRGARVVAAFERREWSVEHVPVLTPHERRAIAVRQLAESSKALDPELLDALATAEPCSNARFLVTVLDELRQHGDHFTVRDELGRLTAAATVDDLLELVLDRYERDFERDRPGLTRDAFTAIWAARTGLTETELRELLGTRGTPLPTAVWAPLHLAAERGIVSRGGLLGFAHDDFRRAVEDRYLPTADARRHAHATLARAFASRPLSERVTDELGWQHLLAGDTDAFARTLGDLDHFELAYRRQPADVRRMWARYGALTGEYGEALRRVYAAVIEDPAGHARTVDGGHTDQRVWGVARVLDDSGEAAAAAPIHRFLVESARRSPAGRVDGPHGDARLRAALVNLGASALATGDGASAVVHLTEAADRCRQAGDATMLLHALHDLAIAHRHLGERTEALAALAEVREIGERLEDDDAVQAALGELALIARADGDLDRSLVLLREQEAAARRLADPLAIDAALAGQATIHSDRGELAAALDRMAARVALMREEGMLRPLSEALLNLGATQLQAGRSDAASSALREAEAHARTLGSGELLPRVLAARSALAGTAGEWVAAEQLAREAELTARAAGRRHELGLALGHLGTARRERGDLEGAEAAHQEELAIAEQAVDPAAAANARGNLGNVAAARGRHDLASTHYDAAIAGLRAADLRPSMLPLLANRGQIRHATGNGSGAIGDYLEAAEIALSIGQVDGARQWAEPALQLAYATGDTASAEQAWTVLAGVARAAGDEQSLQAALGERALLVIGRAAPVPTPVEQGVDQTLLDLAESLLTEQEAICRRLDHAAGLAACIGNRAIVERYRGDLDRSLGHLDEQLAIATRTGNAQGVLFATANRGEVLGLLGRTAEARAALQDARRAAQQYGLAPMVQQLDAMLAAL